MVWYAHFFQNVPQFIVIHTVKGFNIVNKAEIDVFLELPCFFNDPEDVGNLISDSSAFSKTSLNIWNFTVHVLPKPGLENLGITLLVCKLPWWLRRLPGMQETQVQSVGQEDPLEKEIATHSSTLAWRIPWREEPGRPQPMGSQIVGHN